jgi:AraC-like DNA-binding protein
MYLRRSNTGNAVADPNQILFFNKNQPYDIRHPVGGGDTSTVIELNPQLLAEILSSSSPAGAEEAEQRFPCDHTILDSKLGLLQHQFIRLTAQSMASEALHIEEQVMLLVGELLTVLSQPSARASMARSATTRRLHAETTQQVKLTLNAQYREAISLQELSSCAFTSPYHLCRVFKKETGMTIHSYLQRLRLMNAAEWLVELPHENLSRIALDAGFASHSHFTAAFRQAFGTSPVQFRRMAKGEHIRQMSKFLIA